jgi:hypothetical protein
VTDAVSDALALAAKVLEPVSREIGNPYRGAIVAGSRVYGTPSSSSDLDIVIVTEAPWRQRRELYRDGIPIDLSILPGGEIRRSFAQYRNPGMLEMVARGVVIDDRTGLVQRLSAEAKERYKDGPTPLSFDEHFSVRARLRNIFLDASYQSLDSASRVLLTDAFVTLLLEFGYRGLGRWRPSAKQFLSAFPDPLFRALASDALIGAASLEAEDYVDLLRRCADRLGVADCLRVEWQGSTRHELVGTIRIGPPPPR